MCGRADRYGEKLSAVHDDAEEMGRRDWVGAMSKDRMSWPAICHRLAAEGLVKPFCFDWISKFMMSNPELVNSEA